MNFHFWQTNHLQLHCSAKGITNTTRNTSANVQLASFPPSDPTNEDPPWWHTDLAWRAAMPQQCVATHLPGHLRWREAASEQERSPLDAATDRAAISSSASPPAVRIPVVILIWKLLAYLWENSALSLLPHYISPLTDCLKTDCEAIFKLIFLWMLLRNLFFSFSQRKVKRQRASQTQRELICAVTNMPWSHSGQITCGALGFHVYSLHHIFTTGARYNGIDVLYYSLAQSSTVSTAHSESQAQKQIWHMQHQQHDVVSGTYKKVFTLLPVCHCMFSLTCAPAALLQLCMSLHDNAEHVPGHNREIQEWEKVIKGRERWEVSVSTLLHLFVKHCLSSSFDSV